MFGLITLNSFVYDVCLEQQTGLTLLSNFNHELEVDFTQVPNDPIAFKYALDSSCSQIKDTSCSL